MRYVVAVGGVVLVMAASAEAQSTFERGWIDVNFGVAVAAEDAFSMRATGEVFDEPADFGADCIGGEVLSGAMKPAGQNRTIQQLVGAFRQRYEHGLRYVFSEMGVMNHPQCRRID